ncbi:hypothetical protein Tco_1108461 [Tanacetum coccineum]
MLFRNEVTSVVPVQFLPKLLTNKDIQNSESYKEYYAIALGEVPQKTKASVHKKKADSEMIPKEKPSTDPKDKRVKQTGKMIGSGKQKQRLETLSEIALTETEQLKIAIKRSRIQTHSSQASGSSDGVNILSKVPMSKYTRRQVQMKELVTKRGFLCTVHHLLIVRKSLGPFSDVIDNDEVMDVT